MSDSVRPQRWQPTRLPRPWDSPGKNTGVGCHFLLQYMKVKSEREATQLCPTLCDPMDCSSPGSSAHGIFQARVLKNNKKDRQIVTVHKAFFRSTGSHNSSVSRTTLCSQCLINLQSSLVNHFIDSVSISRDLARFIVLDNVRYRHLINTRRHMPE